MKIKMTRDESLVFLCSLNFRTDKAPVEMKNEAQQAMVDVACVSTDVKN